MVIPYWRKSPREAAILPPDDAQPTSIAYRQELMESLSKARQTALHSISRAEIHEAV